MGSLWNQLDMRNRSNVSAAISALQLTGRTEKLVRVDMSATDLQDQGLELLLRNSSAVTELNLTCCKQLTEDVVRIFEAYPCRIQTLLISGCRRIPLRRLKGLAELNELHAFECDLLSANKTEFATIRRNSMFFFPLPLIPTRTNLHPRLVVGTVLLGTSWIYNRRKMQQVNELAGTSEVNYSQEETGGILMVIFTLFPSLKLFDLLEVSSVKLPPLRVTCGRCGMVLWERLEEYCQAQPCQSHIAKEIYTRVPPLLQSTTTSEHWVKRLLATLPYNILSSCHPH